MTVPIELTDVEKEAKDYFTNLFGSFCNPAPDGDTEAILETHLPPWFDEAKFKRGQQFYTDNRFGILQANLCSLLVLLADPKGLRILEHTGKSSTAATAQKRYVSTLIHMNDWYECELTPGSRSWKSLALVRRMHLSASKSAVRRNLGNINQPEMALTTFGFVGFPLVRPHLLGVRYDNREDREAFVHLWAVLGYMLGVEDQYNMCLHRLEVVEMICHLVMRYMFLPSLQLETPLFRQMIGAIVDAFTDYLPFMSYESVMFLTCRLVGIPGYQYAVDMEKERLCRPILSMDELDVVLGFMEQKDGYRQVFEMYRAIFSDKIRLYNVKELNSPLVDDINQNCLLSLDGTYRKLATEPDGGEFNDEAHLRMDSSKQHLQELLGLKHNQELVVTQVEDEGEWNMYLNDDMLKLLSAKGQMNVKFTVQSLNWCYSTIGHYTNEMALSFILYRIKRLHGK
ncbi:uncharacterized protein LOC131282037 [Anopheles ziemanni]|uniref:uncharacterized protein LOC131263477 n=1 Tax=Anopheles coustani TaxID=139045 RepID=UPI0026593E77|nr:uncharacterized protein LOC131263477 [Anopheles coustani]XP_058167402.1 uncharacterized protein LOC131282037 [Anopheles ziemanni]